jgi:hypothetical protein
LLPGESEQAADQLNPSTRTVEAARNIIPVLCRTRRAPSHARRAGRRL